MSTSQRQPLTNFGLDKSNVDNGEGKITLAHKHAPCRLNCDTMNFHDSPFGKPPSSSALCYDDVPNVIKLDKFFLFLSSIPELNGRGSPAKIFVLLLLDLPPCKALYENNLSHVFDEADECQITADDTLDLHSRDVTIV